MMKTETAFRDARLLESLDHIDRRFVAEVTDTLKVPEVAATADIKRSPMKSIKYVAAVAACALLMSTLIPVVQYVSGGSGNLFADWLGSLTDAFRTLDSFNYSTDIDTEHVITESELKVINRIWRENFGKDLAATPEDAMTRSTEGDFYFGRYGKTFVFYKHFADINIDFSIGSYELILPYGELYFLNGKSVYVHEEIANEDFFGESCLAALYDFYINTYLDYTPSIKLSDDDYVLTQPELDMIRTAYGGSADHSPFKSLETAMARKRNSSYYFGKYGETIIVWKEILWEGFCNFTLGGYEFNFYTGEVYFYENGRIYDPAEAEANNIMNKGEIKAFHDHFTERYLPFECLPYTVLEFVPEIEDLTEEEMRSINAAYESWHCDLRYKEALELYDKDEKFEKLAQSYAYSMINYDPHRFFKEGYYNYYQYYGKIGNKVFIATQNAYDELTVTEIGGYKFVLDGWNAELVVCENGKATELGEAYRKGMVTASELAIVHERHVAYGKYIRGGRAESAPPTRLKIADPQESPIKLSDEEMREIVWEFIADDPRIEEMLQSTFRVRCYGKFGNAYAVMMDGLGGTFGGKPEIVAGYTFEFADSNHMYIYEDGVFYRLNKAYELGVISEEDVGNILWENKIEPYTYSNDTSPVQICDSGLTAEQIVYYIIIEYVENNPLHKKGAVYGLRCYGQTGGGCVAFIDCSEIVYENVKTVEKVGDYEFIYSTTQTLRFFSESGSEMSLEAALKKEYIDEAQLKTFYETYRKEHPELYN